jgi:hypothetical protein
MMFKVKRCAPLPDGFHTWFAWRPVLVQSGTLACRVWLETVYRKTIYRDKPGGDYYKLHEYRLRGSPERMLPGGNDGAR